MFPPCQDQGSVGTCSSKLVADYGAVVSRTCIKETCADMDLETVVSKKKRDRDQNVLQSWRDRQHLHKFRERKAELAGKGEVTGSAKIICS